MNSLLLQLFTTVDSLNSRLHQLFSAVGSLDTVFVTWLSTLTQLLNCGRVVVVDRFI